MKPIPWIADIIFFIHMFMFIFVFVGIFLPKRMLPYYLLFVLLIFLDWNDLDGMCIFTKLEHYFRTGIWSTDAPVEGGPEFFRPLLQSVGINIGSAEADRLNNFLFLVAWAIAFIRYAWM
jgi:hypothetical protein